MIFTDGCVEFIYCRFGTFSVVRNRRGLMFSVLCSVTTDALPKSLTQDFHMGFSDRMSDVKRKVTGKDRVRLSV